MGNTFLDHYRHHKSLPSQSLAHAITLNPPSHLNTIRFEDFTPPVASQVQVGTAMPGAAVGPRRHEWGGYRPMEWLAGREAGHDSEKGCPDRRAHLEYHGAGGRRAYPRERMWFTSNGTAPRRSIPLPIPSLLDSPITSSLPGASAQGEG